MISPEMLVRAVDGERDAACELLKNNGDGLAPARVALRSYEVFEGMLAKAGHPKRAGLACKEGCAWCCRGVKVDVVAPEALAIAEWMIRSFEPGELAELKADVAAAFEATRELSIDDRHAQQTPCLFLDETGSCGIYPIRPMRCRGHISHDAAACERACKDTNSGLDVPADLLTQQLSAVFSLGQQQVLSDDYFSPPATTRTPHPNSA